MDYILDLGHDETKFLKMGGTGEYWLEIVGESYYQDALDLICGGKTFSGHEHYCVAYLKPEPHNPHDTNAIAVFIDNLKVGYISRSLAKRLAEKNPNKLIVTVDALITGGWRRGGRSEGHYGVRLDFLVRDSLFLPYAYAWYRDWF